MTQIPVSELKDEQLAYWVARAHGWRLLKDDILPELDIWIIDSNNTGIRKTEYRPDKDCTQVMDLLTSDVIIGFWTYSEGRTIYCVEYGDNEQWKESIDLKIAVCRAYVANTYGEYVETEQ